MTWAFTAASTIALSTLYGYQSLSATKHFHNYGYYAYSNQTWNFGGDLIFNGFAGGVYWTFPNLWNVGVSGFVTPSTWNDRFTRGGPVARSPRHVERGRQWWKRQPEAGLVHADCGPRTARTADCGPTATPNC